MLKLVISLCEWYILASWLWSEWWSSPSLFSHKLFLSCSHIIGIISFSVFFISCHLLPDVIVPSKWILLISDVNVGSAGLINWLPCNSAALHFVAEGRVLVCTLWENSASLESFKSIDLFDWWVLVIDDSLGWALDAVIDFDLRSPNDIIDPRSNVLNLVFPVQVHPDGLVGLHELFEFFLEAVVLII